MSDNKRDAFGNRLNSVDEILARQKKDEEPMRHAVEEVLLPSLEDAAAIFGRGLAAKCGAYNLFGATEAASLILGRYVTLNSLRSVLMRRNGDILDCGSGEVVITVKELAVEVARFTELWDHRKIPGSQPQPAMEAVAMVIWLWLAMQQLPCLLRDFVASAYNHPDYILLTDQPSGVRADDPRQRWSRTK